MISEPRAKIILALALVALGIASRVFPHGWNFLPVTAIALVSSAFLGVRYSVLMVLVLMITSDFFIGFYQWQMMLAVYGSFIATSLIGVLVGKKISIFSVAAGAFVSSVLFFLVTNWAVWQFGTMYPLDFSGLIKSYEMALPFFRSSLVSDVLYSGLLFGVFEFSKFMLRIKAERALRARQGI